MSAYQTQTSTQEQYQTANRIDIKPCNEECLRYVWHNLKEPDRIELLKFGFNDENIVTVLQWDEVFCVRLNGKPISIFGYVLIGQNVWFGYFSTDEHWKIKREFVELSKLYVKAIMAKYPMHRFLVQVDPDYHKSVRWLKSMKFQEKAILNTSRGKILIMEKE